MTTYRTLDKVDLKGKRVLVRVDHNIEADVSGKIKTDTKMRLTLPTLRMLIKKGARIILMTHVGRPKGKRDPKLSTRMAADHLKKLLPRVSITHIEETVGPKVLKAIEGMKNGSILYLENVRFTAAEEGSRAEQAAFGRQLATLANVYVNEAFASCHPYEEASTCAVARLLPAYPGEQLLREVEVMSAIIKKPKRPVTLIMSGAKMETKIPIVEYFLKRGDNILLGGCIANTFIAARGFDVGASKYEEGQLENAQEIMLESEMPSRADVHIPRDVVVANECSESAVKLDLPVENVQGDMMIFDIGKVTIQRYVKIIEESETIIWNGPIGKYEFNRFSHASKRIAEALAKATKRGAVTLLGGGDTIDFHGRYKYPLDAYTFVSSGGGAMLEFISGKKFPALKALEKK